MCMSALFSYLRRRRRNWFIHANVRSTTQRHRPKPLPFSVLRIASRGKMWRARSARRMFSASYARSPSTQSGRQRGRPRRPCSGGMASSSRNAWVESWQLAPVSSIANGMPRPSQIKWRLLPRFARSVGFGPVCSPQKPLAPNSYQQPHGTSRSGHYEKANSVMRSESSPKFRRTANRVNAANKSCQNRSPIVSAASATECHFGAQTEYL